MKVSKVETIQIELDGSTHILTHEDARNLCIKIAKLTGLQVSITREAAMGTRSKFEMGADSMATAFDKKMRADVDAQKMGCSSDPSSIPSRGAKRSLDPTLDDRPGYGHISQEELEDMVINKAQCQEKVLNMVGAHNE